MLDVRTQTQFADVTAALMRSCAIAAARSFAQSAGQGLAFWSDLMRAAAPARGRPALPANPLGMFATLSPVFWMELAQMSPWPAWSWGAASRAPAPPGGEGEYASYRSAGGHASAQVVFAPGE